MNLNFEDKILLGGENVNPWKLKKYNKWQIKEKLLNELKCIKKERHEKVLVETPNETNNIIVR